MCSQFFSNKDFKVVFYFLKKSKICNEDLSENAKNFLDQKMTNKSENTQNANTYNSLVTS